MSDAPICIETEGLWLAHAGSAEVLRFPDLQLAQGRRLLLRGRSGSGKSSWLALVAGLLTPGGGCLRVLGETVGSWPQARRDAWRARRVGVLPQRLHLSEALNVFDNLALAPWAAGLPVDGAAIHRTLASLGLSARADHRPHQLSGGEAQRVALARAVLLRPRLLLADEPTASLDDEACAQALDLLDRAATEAGATLVVATHDARVARAWADAEVLHLPGPGGGVGVPAAWTAQERA